MLVTGICRTSCKWLNKNDTNRGMTWVGYGQKPRRTKALPDESPAGQKPFPYKNESYKMNYILNSNPSCFCIVYVLIFYSNQIVLGAPAELNCFCSRGITSADSLWWNLMPQWFGWTWWVQMCLLEGHPQWFFIVLGGLDELRCICLRDVPNALS